jgi:hypothetical protein
LWTEWMPCSATTRHGQLLIRAVPEPSSCGTTHLGSVRRRLEDTRSRAWTHHPETLPHHEVPARLPLALQPTHRSARSSLRR